MVHGPWSMVHANDLEGDEIVSRDLNHHLKVFIFNVASETIRLSSVEQGLFSLDGHKLLSSRKTISKRSSRTSTWANTWDNFLASEKRKDCWLKGSCQIGRCWKPVSSISVETPRRGTVGEIKVTFENFELLSHNLKKQLFELLKTRKEVRKDERLFLWRLNFSKIFETASPSRWWKNLRKCTTFHWIAWKIDRFLSLSSHRSPSHERVSGYFESRESKACEMWSWRKFLRNLEHHRAQLRNLKPCQTIWTEVLKIDLLPTSCDLLHQ